LGSLLLWGADAHTRSDGRTDLMEGDVIIVMRKPQGTVFQFKRCDDLLVTGFDHKNKASMRERVFEVHFDTLASIKDHVMGLLGSHLGLEVLDCREQPKPSSHVEVWEDPQPSETEVVYVEFRVVSRERLSA